MVAKMKLVAKLHESLLKNINLAHKKQNRTYVARKRKIMFHYFEEGEIYVKMRKPRKKKSLLASWEGPSLFVSYKDKKGSEK
jgi:hypothetical protein